MSIQTITERELALQRELEDAQYAGRLVVQRCDRLVAERDKLAAELKSLRDSGVELPEPGREFFCTKCGSTECKDGAIQHDFPPCNKCGYLGFARGINFTETQLRDYGDRRAMADAYAAGMGDPLVAPPQAQSDHIATTGKMVQPLTFDQIEDIGTKHGLNECDCHGFARAIEQAHGIKVQP